MTHSFPTRRSSDRPVPKPGTPLWTPSGTPTVFMTSPRRAAVRGVSSDGLITTVLPQASAGPTFQVISRRGKFHGHITAITPFGLRTAKLIARPRTGVGIGKDSRSEEHTSEQQSLMRISYAVFR